MHQNEGNLNLTYFDSNPPFQKELISPLNKPHDNSTVSFPKKNINTLQPEVVPPTFNSGHLTSRYNNNMIYKKKPKIAIKPTYDNFKPPKQQHYDTPSNIKTTYGNANIKHTNFNQVNQTGTRAASLGHSSSLGNMFRPYQNFPSDMNNNNNGQMNMNINLIQNTYVNNNVVYTPSNQNYNNNNNNKQFSNDTFINIEDLLLLEEKFTQVYLSFNNKSPNLFNECFELVNYYNNSSLYNKFEMLFKDQNAKIVIHTLINMLIYSITLLYDICFDKEYFSKVNEHLSKILSNIHRSYLLLCEFIKSKVSHKEVGNDWVKKLHAMLSSKIIHLDMTDNDYNQYARTTKADSSNFLTEINYYISHMLRLLRIILKNYTNKNLIEDFTYYYKQISYISADELNEFLKTKVIRVLNKNASLTVTYITAQEAATRFVAKAPYLPAKGSKEFTLVLDLDETLICFKADPNDDTKGILRFRPYLDEFLEEVIQYYELVIFTSGTKDYADPIIDHIENDKHYFADRLYRHHAIIYNNDYVKDIARLGRDLSKVIIVDNMPQNYRLQKGNGIYITAFWGEDERDMALYYLKNILKQIALNYTDLRKGLIDFKDEITNQISSNLQRNSIIPNWDKDQQIVAR